jgi:type VI protein secretion system component VasK
LRNLLGGGLKGQIEKLWSDQILPQAKDVEKGYPFEDGQSDADLAKLTAFLAPGEGKFSKFYDDRLSRYFEESNGQLKQKDSAEIKFTDEFIAYLNNVMAVRKTLFGTNPTPKFEYEFTLRGKDALVEVTIDGQKITSEGTGSIKGTFPAGGSAETGVLMTVGSSGTASTAGTASNTNTAAPADLSAPSLRFQGNWGLFRFVDAGKPQKQAGGEYLLTYSPGGKSVTATIRPSGSDPFNKDIYRQMRAPQSFVK